MVDLSNKDAGPYEELSDKKVTKYMKLLEGIFSEDVLDDNNKDTFGAWMKSFGKKFYIDPKDYTPEYVKLVTKLLPKLRPEDGWETKSPDEGIVFNGNITVTHDKITLDGDGSPEELFNMALLASRNQTLIDEGLSIDVGDLSKMDGQMLYKKLFLEQSIDHINKQRGGADIQIHNRFTPEEMRQLESSPQAKVIIDQVKAEFKSHLDAIENNAASPNNAPDPIKLNAGGNFKNDGTENDATVDTDIPAYKRTKNGPNIDNTIKNAATVETPTADTSNKKQPAILYAEQVYNFVEAQHRDGNIPEGGLVIEYPNDKGELVQLNEALYDTLSPKDLYMIVTIEEAVKAVNQTLDDDEITIANPLPEKHKTGWLTQKDHSRAATNAYQAFHEFHEEKLAGNQPENKAISFHYEMDGEPHTFIYDPNGGAEVTPKDSILFTKETVNALDAAEERAQIKKHALDAAINNINAASKTSKNIFEQATQTIKAATKFADENNVLPINPIDNRNYTIMHRSLVEFNKENGTPFTLPKTPDKLFSIDFNALKDWQHDKNAAELKETTKSVIPNKIVIKVNTVEQGSFQNAAQATNTVNGTGSENVTTGEPAQPPEEGAFNNVASAEKPVTDQGEQIKGVMGGMQDAMAELGRIMEQKDAEARAKRSGSNGSPPRTPPP